MDHLPFAQLIAEARERRDLSLHGVARGMCEAAREEGTYCAATRQSIHSYERGRIPYREAATVVMTGLIPRCACNPGAM